MDKQVIICYTDLKDSTSTNASIGNQQYDSYIKDHLSVGTLLAEQCTGVVIKNMGDALMIKFESFEQSLFFVTRFQQYCTEQPALDRICLKLKIGIINGTVMTQQGDDLLGNGANFGARVQAQALPGEVLLDENFYKGIKSTWGDKKTAIFITSVGERTLKGFEDNHMLYTFNWIQFAKDNQNESLAGVVKKHLELASVELSEVTAVDLATPGIIIWPIVPRDIPTAIHKGQTEVIRLLTLLGWQIHLLITDCGANSCPADYSLKFKVALYNYTSYRGIKINDVTFLSQLYKPEYNDYIIIQNLFQDVSSSLTLQNLLDINNKEYDGVVRDEIAKSATLDCLRPTLTMAAVLYISKKIEKKCIVIAGGDERVQWEIFYGIQSERQCVGAVMIPALRTQDHKHERQRKDKPSWPSCQAFIRAMEQPNLAWWSFCLYIVLPAFPSTSIKIGDISIDPHNWCENEPIPEVTTARNVANAIWDLVEKDAPKSKS